MTDYVKLKLVGNPRDADYLTPGKVYEAEIVVFGSALIVDDTGEKIQINLLSCPHARPAKWEEVQNDH